MNMKEKLPVNPQILKWARTSLGLSLEDAASRIGKSVEIINEWESGKSSPTYPQLEKLAYEIYKRPAAIFFFPEIPKEENPRTEFRTLPNEVTEALPAEIIKMYRKAKAFQIYLEELFEGKRPTSKNLIELLEMKDSTAISQLAWDIRKHLGINIDEQCSWQSTETAFKKWRTAVEAQGIFIFKDAFKNKLFSGFCIHHTNYPIVYINNSMPFSRQIFTIFHELGHLLLHSGGVDFREETATALFTRQYSRYEAQCNLLASEMLVPSRIFDGLHFKVDESNFENLATRFSVSREVILRKYLAKGEIDNGYYEKMVAKWAGEATATKKRKGGGDYYNNNKAYLGENYISLTFSKYYQNKITLESLSTYLGIKANKIPIFEHYALG
jgi:Zn-dependent peptidase ImmA (M78 family)/transcriptional regulator with XRE-family HTH domain